jgi:hypothetical protein
MKMATMEDVKRLDEIIEIRREFREHRRNLQNIINDYEQSKMNHMTKQEWLDHKAEAMVYDTVLYRQ